MNINQQNQNKLAYLFACLTIPIFILYIYHNPVRWDALFYYLYPKNEITLLIAAVIWFAGYGTGNFFLRFLGTPKKSIPNWVISIGLGWGLIAYLMFALALLQILNVYAIAAVVLPLAILGWMQADIRWDRLKRTCAELVTVWSSASWTLRILWLMTGLTVFYAVVSSLMPPTQSDGLRYHLTVPKLYLDAGGFYVLDHLAFSNFPFLIEYLYAIPLSIGQISVPKLIHCSYFIFTLVLVFHIGKKMGGKEAAWVAVLIFSTTPFVPVFASWSFIEFGLTFYILLSFVLMCDWCESQKDEPTPSSIRDILLIGVIAGFSVSCKYTALASTLAVAGFMPLSYILIKKEFLKLFVYGSLVFCIAVLTASPWFIKNWVLLGNPVYPFASHIFPTPNWSEFNALFFAYHAGIKGDMNVFVNAPLSWKLWDMVTLPFYATFFPGDTYHYPHNFGTWPLGAIWLAVVPLLLLYTRWTSRFAFHILFALFLYLLWAFTYRDTRFLLPCIAVLAPVSGIVLWQAVKNSIGSKILLGAVITYNILFTTGLLLIPESYAPWWVVSGLVPEKQYLMNDSRDTRYRNSAFYYLEKKAKQDDTVLFHGIDHGFYCPNPFIGADWFNTDPLIKMSWDASSAEDLIEKLRRLNVKYIVYDYGNIARYNQDFQPYYRFFCLPVEQSVPMLKEWVANETNRLHYPSVYTIWFNKFIPRFNAAYQSAPNVQILQSVLNGGLLEEVYRFDRDENDPSEGIKIVKIN